MTDEKAMDYTPPRQNVLSRLRDEQVIRRVERQAFGFSTQNYHRNERVKRALFAVLCSLTGLGLAAMAIL
ncbi:hypothetical protein [Euzebya rosea]|uniref:hypothetical protein n=1 Tax=Euzebya rosea TaxID=2052804 RepID=UPI001300725C|nr:hypothetical protein [Euzebya rosea]